VITVGITTVVWLSDHVPHQAGAAGPARLLLSPHAPVFFLAWQPIARLAPDVKPRATALSNLLRLDLRLRADLPESSSASANSYLKETGIGLSS